MKRILFVDDEQNILDGLRDLLRKYRHQMEIVFAAGGEAALQELRNSPFDVVVSDMRMPGMDGAALLQKVKEEHPEVIRIVLSGHAERSSIFMALPVSHQFLAKPCDAATLCNVIERSCRLRALLADDYLRKQIGDLANLPSLPRVYRELMNAMSNPDVSGPAIARIIEQDSSMAAKVLQLVNSACFGTQRSIARIDHAVMYLGMDLVKNLALTVHVFSSLAERSPVSVAAFESLQQHALMTARVAARLLHGTPQAHDAITAALLHDVGQLILAFSIPERYKVVVETARSEQRPLHEVETEILGVSHAAAGAYLLGLWGLPFPIVEAVAYHHTPATVDSTTFGITSATALADALVASLDGEPASIDEGHLDKLNVLGMLPHWKDIALEEQQAMNQRAETTPARQRA